MQEKVTWSAGVPTIWLGILQVLDANPGKWDLSAHEGHVRRRLGGAALDDRGVREAPRAHDRAGLGHDGDLAGRVDGRAPARPRRTLDEETQLDLMAMAGLPLPLVEVRARVGDEEIPWDGEAMGELEVRGPWVASSYYDTPEQADRWTADGWFRTGDIVSIHPRGFIQIKDRSKDVIKSGGEWISSVELENALMAHPSVAEAAVIAIPDAKWDERPLAADRAEAGRRGVGGRAARVPRAELREVVAARAVRVRRGDSEDERRQVQEDGAARAVRAGARADLRAALLREVDGPFELADVPDPAANGKVLVRVRAAGINFADVHGSPRRAIRRCRSCPAVLGSEIAGELEDGTRVMAITSGGGGYAEKAAVDRAQVVPLPDHASFAEGAAFLLTFLTAHIPLTRQVRVRPGSIVLVYAAAGGVGSAAIQVARTLGARVIAAVGSAEKLDVCRSLGAEEAYVYDELPEDIGADVVLDPVGGELFAASFARLRPLGTVIAIGSAAGAWAPRSSRRGSSGGTSGSRASISAACCASIPSSSARRSASCSACGRPAR